jgi:protein O-GlcNAc transferase
LRLDGKVDAATAEARAAIKADPKSAAARCFLAAVLNDLGRASEAMEEARRAIELNPLDSDSHLQLANALAKQSQPERAIEESRRALELAPENAFAYNLLLNCLLQSARATEAVGIARDALTLAPFSAELHYNLGLAAAGTGDFVTASIQFGYAVLLRPDSAPAFAKFHASLLSVANGPDAEQQLKELAALAPDSPRVMEDLATTRAGLHAP